MQREHGPENLLAHRAVHRILDLNQGGVDEIAVGIVALTAEQDLDFRIAFRLFDVLLDLVECFAVDHRAHEIPKIGGIADLHIRQQAEHTLAQLGPERFRHIGTGCGAALLTLVLKRTAHDSRSQRVHVRAWVRENEVLPAGLADEPRIVCVAGEIRGHLLPQRLKDFGRSGKMDSPELPVGQQSLADDRGGTGHKVDHSRRQPSLLQQSQHEVVRVGRRRRGLPHDCAPHERRRGREVAANRRKVERCDGVDESFCVVRIEAPEVGQLAGRIDLCLESRLALAQHRRCVEHRAPARRKQVGRFEEDGGPVDQRPVRPVAPRFPGCLDRGGDFFRAGLVHLGEHMAMAVRHHRVDGLAGTDFLAADDDRDLDLAAAEILEGLLQLAALT